MGELIIQIIIGITSIGAIIIGGIVWEYGWHKRNTEAKILGFLILVYPLIIGIILTTQH